MNDVITLNGLEKRFPGMDSPPSPLDCTIHAGYDGVGGAGRCR
ncbi:hypothetical protein ACLB1Q_11075 [Escherichia coli]